MALSENERDRILLKKAIQDDCTESFVTIYQKYQPIVCAFLHQADGMAEDISQMVFIRLLQGKCKYNGSSDVKAYLNGMALMILREQTRSLKRMHHSQIPINSVSDIEVCNDRLSCPVETLSAKEQKEQQAIAIRELPPNSRQAVKLVFEQGIPAVRAAKEIQCDFDVFRQRLEYGLRSLSQKLNAYRDPEER